MTNHWKLLLEDTILEILNAHPGGISEYDLLEHLRSSENDHFGETDYRDQHALFNTHFLLFHILYRLRNRVLAQGDYSLEINPVTIRLYSCKENPAQHLSEHDPLEEYYLELSHMEKTGADEVERMLQDFWERFLRNDNRAGALKILGLQDPVDNITIKKCYRKLVMEHHPDRGGNTADLQALNAAVACLLPEKKPLNSTL
jgi:hypothetical protein